MIKSLTLQNFKGTTANYTFGTGTLIQGRNFAGKSAIDQAIRQLVLGYIPGVAKTAAGLKLFSSGYPMQLTADIAGPTNKSLGICFDKVKGTVKQTVDYTLADKIDEATRVLFDPTIFFGLSDAARISKACELVQSQGVSADDIDAALVAVVGQNPNMLTHLKNWRDTVKGKAPTISDLLTDSDTFWKEKRKIVNADKARMQSTVEGVADLNAGDSSQLPPREEVGAYKSKTNAELIALRDRLSTATALANAISTTARRRAEIAPVAARAEEVFKAEAAAEKALIDYEREFEDLKKKLDQAHEALSNAKRLAADEAAYKARRNILSSQADGVPTCQKAIAEGEKAVADASAAIEVQRLKLAAAEERVKTAKAEAAAPATVRTENEVRTDDFETGAERGVKYLCNAVIGLDDDGQLVVHSVEDWRKLIDNSDENEEQTRLKEYELAQAVSEAVEEVQAIENTIAEIKLAQDRAQRKLVSDRTALTRAQVSAEELEQTSADRPAAPSAEELQSLGQIANEASRAMDAGKSNLQNLRTDHLKARDASGKAKTAVEELTRLDAQNHGTPLAEGEIEALRTEAGIKENSIKEADATLHKITAAEQDQKRIAEAAKKREAVEVEANLIGKVIDVITQKKTELVSGSIEAPLAVANKLGAGILKGPLVFEEGEIGMRVGDAFVSARVFSGTETAIVMMGLTAGLAAKSALRVLLLDEIGRLDYINAQKLITNLCGMVDDGDVDQFLVIGPEDERLTDGLALEQTSGRLNVLHV